MMRFNPLNFFSVRCEPSSCEGAVEAEEFASLMAPFELLGRRVAVAVSGGPDSMALAWCVKRWVSDLTHTARGPGFAALRRGRPGFAQGLRRGGRLPLDSCFHGNDTVIVAFIVDHQLREESAEEAAIVRERLAAIGVESEVLRWEHGAVSSRVHVLARKARYDLLIEACKRRGITDLLLAHQREDQAETILMRFAKGSGPGGLAGMAPVSVVRGVRLVRPFLSVSKARLVATCVAAGLSYVTDPSNVKERYARGRLRRVGDALAKEGFTTERLCDLGERAREAREALDHYTAALLRVAARMDVGGVLTINLEQLRSAPKAVALKALGACLLQVHPADYAPERAMLLPLLKALCSDKEMGARTLGGCVVGRRSDVRCRMSGVVTIMREFAGISDAQPIAAGETVVWDGRWRVSLAADCKVSGLEVRALGRQTHEEIDRVAPGLRRLVPQGRARAALPGIWEGNRLVMVPGLVGCVI